MPELKNKSFAKLLKNQGRSVEIHLLNGAEPRSKDISMALGTKEHSGMSKVVAMAEESALKMGAAVTN